MGRPSKPQRSSYPPIPAELLALINQDGHYIHRYGFFEDGHPYKEIRQRERERYKQLMMKYCADAGIRLLDFRNVARSVKLTQ